MSLSYAEEPNLAHNPLYLLEEIAGANDWLHERASVEQLENLVDIAASEFDRLPVRHLERQISGGRDGVGADRSCRICLTR